MMQFNLNRLDAIFVRRNMLAVDHRVLALERLESALYMHQSSAVLIGWLSTPPKISADSKTAYLNVRESPTAKSSWFVICDGQTGRQLAQDSFVLVIARPIPVKNRRGGTVIEFHASLIIDLRETVPDA